MAKTRKPTKPQKTQTTRKPVKTKKAPQAPLAAFMKTIWSKPELMEKFASGRPGREKVLENSVLSAKHAEMVRKGCVRDIMAELTGAATMQGYEYLTSNINTADIVQCGHAECNAFMSALKPIRAKNPQS